MQNPSNIYVKLQFFNSNLLCNKKVPDGERKVLGIEIFVRERQKFEIWRFDIERKQLIGINGNVQGTEKLSEIERSLR